MFDSSNRECRIDNVTHWNPKFDPYPEGFFWLGRSYISIKTIIFGGQTKETKAKWSKWTREIKRTLHVETCTQTLHASRYMRYLLLCCAVFVMRQTMLL